ncbi:unnamed protein product [marine sediment metagenome]|uniref:Uncharacterized protein n=1 Tax=marine sediment metagenome TaxID=412755 RepID=X1SSK6_9ZZZZ
MDSFTIISLILYLIGGLMLTFQISSHIQTPRPFNAKFMMETLKSKTNEEKRVKRKKKDID